VACGHAGAALTDHRRWRSRAEQCLEIVAQCIGWLEAAMCVEIVGIGPIERAGNVTGDGIEGLADAFNFQCSYDGSSAAHGRKLTLHFSNSEKAIILFDQGFGYWRAQSGDRHDFRASPQQQVKALLASGAFVAGQGETYIALGRGR